MKKWTKPGSDARTEQLLAAGLVLARRVGWQSVTRDALATEAGVSAGLINSYFGTIAEARNAIMQYAVRQSDVEVVAQGLLAGNLAALRAPQALRSLCAGRVFDA